jgi:phosphohistidine phosphatase
MDLILWRHADAEEGAPDLERKLTAKGRKQAARMAEWLKLRLPSKYSLLVSPAARAQETAEALEPKFKTVASLAPGAQARQIEQAAGWPDGEGTVIVVGHQPDLGIVAARLVSGAQTGWSIKKGGLWWLSYRVRDEGQVVVRAVMSPDLL